MTVLEKACEVAAEKALRKALEGYYIFGTYIPIHSTEEQQRSFKERFTLGWNAALEYLVNQNYIKAGEIARDNE